jgi:hypothetical protein
MCVSARFPLSREWTVNVADEPANHYITDITAPHRIWRAGHPF